MRGPEELRVSQVRSTSEINFAIPNGLSFFEPHLQYFIKETLDVGGEAYVSKTPKGVVSGLFTYDDSEKIGAIYTRSREVFDYFYELKPFNYLFAELSTEHASETYDIYTVDLENRAIEHRFSHEISTGEEENVGEIERFMVSTHPGMNRRWVNVALRNGDRCLTVRLGNDIAGLGWLSVVNDVGRLHSLFVKPQFRRIGIGEDLLSARLLWLKSKRARLAFSEISRNNSSSSRIAMKGHMTVSGQIFQYFNKDPEVKMELKS